MDETKNMETEWRKYVPPDADLVDLEIASDLRQNGVYLLSPKTLPSPCSKSHPGLLGKDNMFRPINARHVYGILPDWTAQQNGPEATDQIFSKTPIREAILLDLQGFPNDLTAPTAALRLRPIAPWGTYFRECFLKAASDKALLQVLHMGVTASPILKNAEERFFEKPENAGLARVEIRSRQKEALTRRLEAAGKRGDSDVATAPQGEDDGKGTNEVDKKPNGKEKAGFDGSLL